jgi:hypothetical protein
MLLRAFQQKDEYVNLYKEKIITLLTEASEIVNNDVEHQKYTS